MHIDYCKSTHKGKEHISILLRRTFRENGKVRHQTVLNLTNFPEQEIKAIELALKFKKDLTNLGSISEIKTQNLYSFGAVFTLYQIANELGITKALGNSQIAKQILWLCLTAIIMPSSKSRAVRLARTYAALEVLDLQPFDEEDLYNNLPWLAQNQQRIEKKLYQFRFKNKEPEPFFLYDVTSSYFEGLKNYFAMFGYNRDKKKGKKQMVIGLLTDKTGYPLSVQVFKGNTCDVNTFPEQIEKVQQQFGAENIILIGDKGMIKTEGKDACIDDNISYITTITKPQIQKLIDEKFIQLSMFDKTIKEIILKDEENNFVKRYLLRRNPDRAREISKNRKEKYQVIKSLIETKHLYLQEHKRAHIQTAFNEVKTKINSLKIDKWLGVEIVEGDNKLKLIINKVALKESTKLDGCYVVESNVKPQILDAKQVHDRYKDLSKVENAFSQLKTNQLEIRPTYVRSKENTQAHVFIHMLSYMILHRLKELWSDTGLTAKEIIAKLNLITIQRVSLKEKVFYKISEPNVETETFLKKANIILPAFITIRKEEIYTKKERLKNHFKN
jgi:transposase